MILTEDDAKRRQCQETFGDSTNRHTCVASDCMAWRWATEDQERDAGFTEAELDGNLVGYCGKAGVP